MKKRNRWIALLLGIMMVFALMPAIAFAEGDNYPEYTADYYGEFFLTCNKWGYLDLTEEKNDGNYVVVRTGDEDIRLDFECFEDGTYYLRNNNTDDFSKSYSAYFVCDDEYGYSNGYNKVHMEIYGSKYSEVEWKATVTLNKAYVYNEVSSIEYQPSNNILYSDKIYDGHIYYELHERTTHYANNTVWTSCFEVGDKLIIHYADGTTKTYINKNFYDEEHPDNDWVDGFFCGDEVLDGYSPSMWFEEDEPKVGDNIIIISYHGRLTSFTAKLETPESRAAEKAKADAEAKAKADALVKASNINKGTVSASDIKKASDLGATEVTLDSKVKKISKNAFKGTNIKTVIVKTKKLKAKSVKGSLKGSKVKTIKVKVGKAKENKKYVKAYKKIFTKKIAGKKASVK